MAGVKKINHKGTEILFIDYEGTKSVEEMVEILKEAQKIVMADNKPYLQLISVIDVYVMKEYMVEAKKVAKDTPKLATKRAIIGINSIARKILLRSYNLILGKDAVVPFDTLEDAMDWLVE